MSCKIENEEAKSPLSRAVLTASKRFIPLNVTIELSTKCNLRCKHCYNFDRKQTTKPESDKPALSPEQIKNLLKEIRAEGGLIVAFSGGEALLHPHLLEYIQEARKLNLAVRLKTNGVLLTEKKVKELMDAGARDVEVSVYGASATVHDTFTRAPGSFEKTIQGIRNAKAAGMATQANFVLHHEVAAEFDSLLELAESLGVQYAVSTEMTKRYDGTTDSLEDRLTEEDLKSLYSGPRKDFFKGQVNNTDSVQCACAKTNCGIGSDGTVYPCIGAPIASGNLHEDSFSKIWKESPVFNEIRGLTLKDFKVCGPCSLRPYCQRSSGAIYVNTGNYTGSEDWTCAQASLLKELNEKAD